MYIIRDLVVVTCAIMVPLLLAHGMFGDVEGGGMPKSAPFPWHPVSMAIAFPLLMTCGRWSYIFSPGGATKENMRFVHLAFMVMALACACAGYYFIFKAHSGSGQFFGYNFKANEWKPFIRIAHVWVGYAALVLTLAQALMGCMKFANLPERSLNFHGFLGKLIILLANLAFLIGVYMWPWTAMLKVAIAAPVVVVATACCIAESPAAPKEEEDEPLAPGIA